MNFFQLAQSSKNKPSTNAFTSSPSSFMAFPSIAQDDKIADSVNKNETNEHKISQEGQINQNSRSPFIFNPKKVTFNSSETSNVKDDKINSILLLQPQSNIPNISSEIIPIIEKTNGGDEKDQIDEIKNNDIEITSENFEEQMNRLEKDFKSIASWSQKQISNLQQIQEGISISLLDGNELLAKLNSIINS